MNDKKFKIGETYNKYDAQRGGSVDLECVARTGKTVTLEYSDGERVIKRIRTKVYGVCNLMCEYVTFGKTVVEP